MENIISSAFVLIHFAVKMLCYFLIIVLLLKMQINRKYVYGVVEYSVGRIENYHFSKPR